MSKPIISVVMPVYNSGKYLREAIDSILNQDFSDFEFIILNDGSTDDSVEIIKSYSDKRIRFFNSEVNQGLVFQLNKGIEESQGKYIARMDSDDTCLPNRFSLQYEFMEKNPDIGICGSSVNKFGNYVGNWNVPILDEGIRFELVFGSPFPHNSVIIRKDVLLKNRIKYNKEEFPTEDIDMWIRILDVTKGANFSDCLTSYRVHGNQVTSNEKDVLTSHHRVCFSYFENKFFSISEEYVDLYNILIDRLPISIFNYNEFEFFLEKMLSNNINILAYRLTFFLDRLLLSRILAAKQYRLLWKYIFKKRFFQRFNLLLSALKTSILYRFSKK